MNKLFAVAITSQSSHETYLYASSAPSQSIAQEEALAQFHLDPPTDTPEIAEEEEWQAEAFLINPTYARRPELLSRLQ